MSFDSKPFKLTIWQPISSRSRVGINFCDPQSAAEQRIMRLQEQIYSWEPKGVDVWGSIKAAEDTVQIRDLLLAFDPSRLDSDRGLDQFKRAIDRLGETLASDLKTDWAEAEELIDLNDFNEDGTNFRTNSAAALYNHLKWIHEVFRDVPNASVTVR